MLCTGRAFTERHIMTKTRTHEKDKAKRRNKTKYSEVAKIGLPCVGVNDTTFSVLECVLPTELPRLLSWPS